MSGYDRNFSTAAAIAPSSNAICRNKASGSDCDSFSVLVSRCAYSTRPSGNTADVMKPHRAIICRLTSARKPSWSMTRPSKSTCSLPYWLSPDGFLPRLTLRKINPHGLMALNRHFSSSRRVQERLSATTPDVWFTPTNAAAQSNGRNPLRVFVSTGPSSLLLVRHIIRSQRARWKERYAMYKAMPCKANRSKVCRQSIIGWSTGP